MPTLLFADREALRLVLASGGLPAYLTGSPAHARIDAHGQVWLRPAGDLQREAAATLVRLGAAILDAAEIDLSPITCWAQLLPLQPADFPPDSSAPVLFALPPARLAGFAAEVRRLSPNSAIAFRTADLERENADILVRVERPPYATFLRTQQDTGISAFVEQSPRVWVEAGFRHPLPEQVATPPEQIVLIRARDGWSVRPDCPFERELSAFPLSRGGAAIDRSDIPKIEMRLRLEDGGEPEAAELWVIHERPWEQLANLAAEAGAAFLSRFRYALVEPQGRPIVLLWAKPSKRTPPPPLQLGLGCRRYRKLPNLFVPCGQRLTPPPRRDILRNLAPDGDRLAILLPQGQGRWLPVNVPESAFLSLDDYVEYSADASASPFAVPSSHRVLEWEPFAEVELPSRPGGDARIPEPALVSAIGVAGRGWLARLKRKLFTGDKEVEAPIPRLKVGDAVRQALPSDAVSRPPDGGGRRPELHERRFALEAKVLHTFDGTDSDIGLLPELAGLHAQLGNAADAAMCWLNAIWERADPPDWWLWGWLQTEKKLSRVLFGENDLPQLLEAPPSPSSVRLLAACLVWLARQGSDALGERLGELRLRLEAHEDWLPVRAAWLAQIGLARGSHGDVLALARARDRLAGRLARNGLSLELDVPSFARFAGRDASERFQLVRDWLIKARDSMHRWADQLARHRPANYSRAAPSEFPDRDGRCTRSFIDLMLAWGLAQLGEQTSARDLARDAQTTLLREPDEVLAFLGQAFRHRIDRALANQPPGGALPSTLLTELERLRREPGDEGRLLAPYRIDALRHHSRILEPDRHIDPYGQPLDAGATHLDLPSLLDRAEAALSLQPPDQSAALRYLEAALDVPSSAPLDERLAQVDRVADRFPDPLPGALLLAAEFTRVAAAGDVAAAHRLLPRLRRLFRGDGPRYGDLVERMRRPPPPADPRGPADLRRLEALPGYCLRDLRRLGLNAEADELLVPAVEWMLHGQNLANLHLSQPESWPSALRALLRLAGNWFADRDEDRAVAVLDSARKYLLYGPDLPPLERAALARSYAAALAHAPPRMALGRFDEMFRDLAGLYDTRETNSHYALSPLSLVDSVIRAALSDHFALAPTARRWLDADEFRIRRRIQRDLAAAIKD